MHLDFTGSLAGAASRRRVIGVALLAVASTIGCAGAAPAASTTTPATSQPTPRIASPTPAAPTATIAAPTSAAPAGPVKMPAAIQGKWTADVTGTTATSGAWKMEITAGNLFLTNPKAGADPFSLDPKAVNDTQIVFPTAADCPDQGIPTEGTYGYAVAGDKLTITLVEDSCVDRASVLNHTVWNRQS